MHFGDYEDPEIYCIAIACKSAMSLCDESAHRIQTKLMHNSLERSAQRCVCFLSRVQSICLTPMQKKKCMSMLCLGL